jgi:glutamine amidotransferase
VAIIDYEAGNMFSVQHACESAGLRATVTSRADEILQADAAILPGVGAFGDAMDNMRRLDLVEPVREFVWTGKPFFGICLGMQLLFTESDEFGRHSGLDLIKGYVRRFSGTLNGRHVRVPQIGWNRIFKYGQSQDTWNQSPMRGINNGAFMYFVHSYFVEPADRANVLSVTDYQSTVYCSSIMHGNIFAAQFHPEKSAQKGLAIYENWAKTVRSQGA